MFFEVFTEAFIPSKKVLREKEIIKKNVSKAAYLRKGKGKKMKHGTIMKIFNERGVSRYFRKIM